jgi:fucose permease
MTNNKPSMFVTADGKNVLFTFIIVSSLFCLWGICNGMIDVMDKHFQDELGLTKAQSAWVQFAHYLGYFLMALPAGWLATRLGYKGGIIAGLLLVAVGGFWFIPATRINAMAHAGTVSAATAFVGYLTGVCAIAAGLTFLETIANPYTTVLGPTRYAATRINLAQSCNGIGWIFGPIIGGMFFYTKDATTGRSTGSETLYIPYVIVGVVVCVLAVVFYFSYIPDIKMEDDYHLDDREADNTAAKSPAREVNRGLSYVLLLLNGAVLVGVFAMVLSLILSAFGAHQSVVWIVSGLGLAVVAVALIPVVRKISHHSMWTHPHFSSATLAQFFYVAAQAGIFSFLINYMTSEVPPIPASWRSGKAAEWIEVQTAMVGSDVKDWPAFAQKLKQKSDAVSAFLISEMSSNNVAALAAYKEGTPVPKPLRLAILQDLNRIVKQDPTKVKPERLLSSPERFSGITLSAKTAKMLGDKAQQAQVQQDMTRLLDQSKQGVAKRLDYAQLNRNLLLDAYPNVISFNDSVLTISDKGASFLASVGFFCFLIGRFTGAGLLRRVSAHKILGLYGVMNVLACFLVFCKFGWISVACVFASYFFMSIMFPTIFALGIFGLGARAKQASAFIVMAIMGGAMLPKLMGHVADQYDMSRGFIVPMVCFVLIAVYGYCWPKLSRAESLHGVGASGGH